MALVWEQHFPQEFHEALLLKEELSVGQASVADHAHKLKHTGVGISERDRRTAFGTRVGASDSLCDPCRRFIPGSPGPKDASDAESAGQLPGGCSGSLAVVGAGLESGEVERT